MDMLFKPFSFLASNLSILSVPDEGYSINGFVRIMLDIHVFTKTNKQEEKQVIL